jgi:hypothetical protein
MSNFAALSGVEEEQALSGVEEEQALSGVEGASVERCGGSKR